MKFPKMVGLKGASEILGVSNTNLKRLRGLPEPITQIDNKSVWLESDILAFKEATGRDIIKKQLASVIANRDTKLSREQAQAILDIIKGGAEG
jgi:hypothetical protein